MTNRAATDSAILLSLLGLGAEEPPVQLSLEQLAHGMQPELDPEDEEALVDWVTVNEIGLEYGFEDEAYVRAADPDERRRGRLILSQLYFYGDTPKTRPFPYPLPFGLSFSDDRTTVRRKLAAHESLRRSYIRDFWCLPQFNLAIAYRREGGLLESVFCYLPYAPWPPVPGEAELIAAFTPEAFAELFGRRWSSADIRARLASLGYEAALPEVRSEHVADFRLNHGLELVFAPSTRIRAADQRYPRAHAFAGVTFYSSRDLDAREWIGSLPLQLAFADTQAEFRGKLGEKPAEQHDDELSGVAIWHLERFTLSIVYSNLENRILRITLLAPGYWEPTGSDGA